MNKQEIAKRIEQVENELASLRAEMDKQEIGVGDWIARACGDVLSEALKVLKAERKLTKYWQDISASAHTRLQEAIEHMGSCQSPIKTDTGGSNCGECIWCKYYE
jgi:hypothetical protein